MSELESPNCKSPLREVVPLTVKLPEMLVFFKSCTMPVPLGFRSILVLVTELKIRLEVTSS